MLEASESPQHRHRAQCFVLPGGKALAAQPRYAGSEVATGTRRRRWVSTSLGNVGNQKFSDASVCDTLPCYVLQLPYHRRHTKQRMLCVTRGCVCNRMYRHGDGVHWKASHALCFRSREPNSKVGIADTALNPKP